MKSRCKFWISGIVALSLFGCGLAVAEVNVSLTISGDLEEILAIVQHLKQMGFGAGALAPDDPMKLEIHSVQSIAEQPGAGQGEAAPLVEDTAAAPEGDLSTPVETPAAPEEAAPPPEPALALEAPAATPSDPSPGVNVLVTVTVIDKEGRIDTLAASLANTPITADLKDDGVNGDMAAGDGVWSCTLPTPPDGGGGYEILITAYDAHGAPLMALNPDQIMTIISTKTAITIPK